VPGDISVWWIFRQSAGYMFGRGIAAAFMALWPLIVSIVPSDTAFPASLFRLGLPSTLLVVTSSDRCFLLFTQAATNFHSRQRYSVHSSYAVASCDTMVSKQGKLLAAALEFTADYLLHYPGGRMTANSKPNLKQSTNKRQKKGEETATS